MLFTIYYICTFLNPSLKAACFLKKIRLKKFAFSIYQQFPKMMSMDFYTRQVGKPHMVTVSHELNCHVISGSPPISTGNSESNLLSTTTQQPAQQVQHVRGVSGRTRYGGSEVTCRKPDTFLLAATFAAINFAVSLFLLRV